MVVKRGIITALLCIHVFLLQVLDFTISLMERSGANVVLYHNLKATVHNCGYTANFYSSADNNTITWMGCRGNNVLDFELFRIKALNKTNPGSHTLKLIQYTECSGRADVAVTRYNIYFLKKIFYPFHFC